MLSNMTVGFTITVLYMVKSFMHHVSSFYFENARVLFAYASSIKPADRMTSVAYSCG